MNKHELESQIKALVSQYHDIVESEKAFFPQQTKITTGGAVFTESERHGLVDVALSMWLTSGKKTEEFQKRFSEYLGVRYTLLTNSGSSANLLAFSALTSAGLGDKRILPGDYFITVAAGFPTTITPALQYGCIPIFVDVNLDNFNIIIEDLEKAYRPGVKAVILAHSLGIPFDVEKVRKFCDDKGIWLIEDACDALGGTYRGQKLGTFGDISTFSFFPAHQITMGEGGAVVTNNAKLRKYIDSFMSWGKACWCAPGQDGCCGQRHCMKLGELPFGFDHKYIFEHLGYNLKVTEMQAAIGLAQLDKVDEFTQIRRANWIKYWDLFYSKYRKYFYVHDQGMDMEDISRPSFFGFALTIRPDAPFSRAKLIQFLESNQIQTRVLFGGDLRKHPAFLDWRDVRGANDVSIGDLPNTELIMNNTFWIGCHHGITDDMTEYVISKFKEFLDKYDN